MNRLYSMRMLKLCWPSYAHRAGIWPWGKPKPYISLSGSISNYCGPKTHEQMERIENRELRYADALLSFVIVTWDDTFYFSDH